MGLGLTVFVEVEAGDHSPAWRDAFSTLVAAEPEVVEVYRMAGDADYLLKVVTTDMPAFDALYKRLTEGLAFRNVTSLFAMERIAFTTALPITNAP